MSERPGPSPEELENPEQAEKARLFKDSFRVASGIVFKHPDTERHGDTEKEHLWHSLRLEDIGKYSKVVLAIHSESPLKQLGSIQYIESDKPSIEEIFRWNDDREFADANYSKYTVRHSTYGDMGELLHSRNDASVQERQQLLEVVNDLQQELEERGEI